MAVEFDPVTEPDAVESTRVYALKVIAFPSVLISDAKLKSPVRTLIIKVLAAEGMATTLPVATVVAPLQPYIFV